MRRPCRYQAGIGQLYPNALHVASGIAVNKAVWARERAQGANGQLASLGIRV
jgi:hypothetical protein